MEDDEDGHAFDIYKLSRDERMQHLYEVFTKHDKDRSGELDTDEMYDILRELGIKLSKRVCKSMLIEMDADGTGTVDMEEFVQFFDRVQSFNDVQEIIKRKGAIGKIKEQVMGLYMIVILVFTFFVVLNYVKSKDKTQESLITVILSFGLLSASFFYIVLLPLVQLTLRGWVKPPLPANWDPKHQRKRPPPGEPQPIEVIDAVVMERQEDEETGTYAPKVTWRRKLEPLQATLSDGSAWETRPAWESSTLPGMVEASPPRPVTADPVAPTSSPTFTRTRGIGDSLHVQEIDDMPLQDPDGPYNYDHLNIPDVMALKPSFNPWSSSRARIY
jgi:hypothetical protein